MQYQGRGYLFAQCWMRAAKCDRGRDCGVLQQNLVYFMRRDIFSAPDDDVLYPARQMQITVFVQHSLVARAKPSIHEAVSVGFGIVLITPKHACSLNDDFPSLIGSEVNAFVVHNADANARTHADRTGFAMPWRQGVRGHLVRSFGHSVGFDERHSKESFDLVNKLW